MKNFVINQCARVQTQASLSLISDSLSCAFSLVSPLTGTFTPSLQFLSPCPWAALSRRWGSDVGSFPKTPPWAGLTGWFGRSWSCWANCPPGPGPRPRGEGKPCSSRPGSPAAGAVTPGGTPPPPDPRSDYSAFPLVLVHSHPNETVGTVNSNSTEQKQ